MSIQPNASLATPLLMAIEQKRLTHALILAGKDSGQQAKLLAQALLCTQAADSGHSCGQCLGCKQYLANQHVDCHIYLPDKSGHSIESMRQLQNEAYLQSYTGGNKVFIIEEAELLLSAAANSLLKLLEEPPDDCYFILVCTAEDSLLSTIRSRCQLFYLGSAQDLSLDEQLLAEIRPEAEAFWQELPQMPLYQALLQTKKEKKDKVWWLHYLSILQQLTMAFLKGEGTAPFDHQSALAAGLLLEQSLSMLNKNINQKLLLSIIFIRFWTYAHKEANN